MCDDDRDRDDDDLKGDVVENDGVVIDNEDDLGTGDDGLTRDDGEGMVECKEPNEMV